MTRNAESVYDDAEPTVIVRANVKRDVERLVGLKPILTDHLERKLKIVGAHYELRKGKVVVLT